MSRTATTFALLALGTVALGGCSAPAGNDRIKMATPSSAAPAASTAAQGPASVSLPPVPTAADYQIKIKTLSKQCFGTAGCNLSVRLSVEVVGTAALTRAAELSVRVTGGMDGAQVETITVDGEGNYSAPEILVQTPNQGSKLRAKITDVELTDG